MHTWAKGLLLLVAALGVVGTVLPLLPGTPIIFGAVLVYARLTGWAVIGGRPVLLLGLLAVTSYGADLALGAGIARRFGAARSGAVGALVGALVGVGILGPIGLVLGPLLGAVLAELLRGRYWREAVRAGVGAGAGALVAALVRILIALVMFFYVCLLVLSH